jgi:hypothetical protein
VRRIPEYPQLDNWFRLEVTVIWERVAFPARHLDRDGLQDARHTPNAPPRPFRVSKFFLGVHRMNKECGAFQHGDAFRHDIKDGDEDEDEVFDPIDGCTEENVGWMRLAATTVVGTEFYVSVFDYPGGGWYVSYKRPPETVIW